MKTSSWVLLRGNVKQDAEANWVRPVPGKGRFPLFRLYGPEKPRFGRTWKPDDLVEVK